MRYELGDHVWVCARGFWRFAKVAKVTPTYAWANYTTGTGRTWSAKFLRAGDAFTEPGDTFPEDLKAAITWLGDEYTVPPAEANKWADWMGFGTVERAFVLYREVQFKITTPGSVD